MLKLLTKKARFFLLDACLSLTGYCKSYLASEWAFFWLAWTSGLIVCISEQLCFYCNLVLFHLKSVCAQIFEPNVFYGEKTASLKAKCIMSAPLSINNDCFQTSFLNTPSVFYWLMNRSQSHLSHSEPELLFWSGRDSQSNKQSNVW